MNDDKKQGFFGFIVFSNYYSAWKNQARQAALKCWELVKVREKAQYGPESYFASRGGHSQDEASRPSFAHSNRDARSTVRDVKRQE